MIKVIFFYFNFFSELKNLNFEAVKFLLIWVNYFVLCSLQPGLSWKNHGTLSRIFFNMLIFKIFFLKVGIIGIKRIEKKSKKIATWILIIFIGWIIGFLAKRAFFSKSEYFTGFNNQSIKDEGDLCHFFKIGVNWYGAFDRFFWDFAHQNSDCGSRELDLFFISRK